MNRQIATKVLFVALTLVVGPAAFGQRGKPRVYINGTGNVDVRTDGGIVGGPGWAVGSAHSTVGAHDQTMELAKDLNKQCPDVTVTLSVADADYTVKLNHEAFHGLIFKNNQVMVTNRRGDLVFSNTTRAVTNSTKDSCATILADWKANGRIEVPATPAAVPTPVETPATAPTLQATTGTPPPAQPSMQVIPGAQTESLGEVARRLKAQKAAQQQQSTTKTTRPPTTNQ